MEVDFERCCKKSSMCVKMSAIRLPFFFILGCVFCILPFVNSALAQEPDTGLVENETREKRIARLEKMILELQDANSMLMENLAGCIEENEALRNRMGPVREEDSLSEKNQID